MQATFFSPGSPALQAIWQGMEESVLNATGEKVIKTVEFSAKFSTPTKIDQLFEEFSFTYMFPKKENECARVILNHAQDPDGPCVTRKEIERREGPEKEKLSQLTEELKTITSCADKIARCYKFFMDVSKELLHATRVRDLNIIVRDSKDLYHLAGFSGNYSL